MTTTRATSWSVTINNPTAEDDECLHLARMKPGWSVIGQLEKGSEGTPHYQLMVRTPQTRFSQVKKAFPRGHIEVARNAPALQSYVQKAETRLSELPTGSEKYPSVSKMWDLILSFLSSWGKEGLDLVCLSDGDIRFYSDRREAMFQTTPLVLFDEVIRHLISDGYFVEHHACNPQVRQQWKLFAREILSRSHKYTQTDRQTDSVQSVEIPAYHEINANDSSSSQASSGTLGQEYQHSEAASETRSSRTEGSDEDC